MIANRILTLCVIAAVSSFAAGHFTDNTTYALLTIPFVAGVIVTYIMTPQINWWWYKRHPQDVPAPLRKILETRMPFYKILSPIDQTKFRQRLGLFIMGNNFMAQGDSEDVPEDIKLIIAANACQLTLGEEEFIFEKFENIVMYAHPFPSPQYNDWHVSELYEEDGVLLFCAEHLMKSFMEPHQYFNIGIYEYAKAFKLTYPNYKYPEKSNIHWADIQAISRYTQEHLEAYIGLKDLDMTAILMTTFFTHPQQFKLQKPLLYGQLARLFKLV